VAIENFVNGLDRTYRDTGTTIDADIGINIAPFIIRVEALNGAVFDAIGKQAKTAIVGNDMRHGVFCSEPATRFGSAAQYETVGGTTA
jgi:hypothetical protein